MFIVISHQNPAPLYQQVTDQIIDAITDGTLNPDDKLPSIREVAGELKISEITVKRAYADLEQEGYIFTRAGMGSFVVDINKDKLKKMKLLTLSSELEIILRSNEKFGINSKDIIRLIKELEENK
ncbi:MAG: GntR family transcriptional regulator [Candidatus Aminicenantes bacterium]|nr:GntR family transcriptional regulator [Candidatus Aminicenantes bacterium]